MVEYNLDWLKEKGFFEKSVPLEIEGKEVLVDRDNLLAYVEVEATEEVEKAKRDILSVYGKTKYIWFYFPSESKLKTFRKIGEVKWFYYSPRIKTPDYRKSRIDKLNKFSPGDMNILFDIKDVVNKFYDQLWKANMKMARGVKQLKEEKSKLLAVQHLIDRLIFFYFLSQLGLVSISTGNREKAWKLDRTHTREFFKWICGFLDDEKLQEFLNRIFFDVLGKVKEDGWSRLEFEIKEERFFVEAPSLNGGLFREEKIEGVAEREIKIAGTKELILHKLNEYNWIIGEYSPEEEDVIGDLTPEIIGHIYEKFVVSLGQIGLEKIDFDDIQMLKGELRQGRKKIGAYYTPEEITNYISKNTIYPYITDKINERFKRRYKNIWNELLNKKRLTEEEVEIVKFLHFDVLTQLRICDNACGSASFLIAAGYVLLRLYSRVIKLLKVYLRDDEDVKVVLKSIEKSPNMDYRNYNIVRRIVTNNLYGVDIMGGAVEIAKLRFWLWLISQVKVKEDGGIKTLPNLEFNLIVGNSLIGFVDIKDIAKTLSSWLGESEEKWLKNLAKEKQKFKTLSVRDAGRVKEKLDKEIKKARVFLNRRFFETIKAKGIEMPYKDYEDFAEDLKPFHWGFEFSEVFELDKPKEERGFDVVIGNPPYVQKNAFKDFEKTIIKKDFEENSSNTNIAAIFINQTNRLNKKTGYQGMIIPKSLLFSKSWLGDRKRLLERLVRLVDVSKAFKDVLLEQAIYVANKGETKVFYYSQKYDGINFSKYSVKISKELANKFGILITDISTTELEIFNKIRKNSFLLGGITKTFSGIPYQSKLSHVGDVAAIGGKEIGRYSVKGIKGYFSQNFLKSLKELSQFKQEKIISQRIIAHVTKPKDRIVIMSSYDEKGTITVNTVSNTILKEKKYNLKTILLLLNSVLTSWFAYHFIYAKAVRSMDLYDYFIGKILVSKLLSAQQQPFIHLCNYMLFLNETEERRKAEKELIEFIDKQIIDSLVYELYFKEKFEEEGLKTNLLGLVEPYLKDVEELKSDEEKLKAINEVVEKIKSDKKVRKEIEKIKSHEWVKVIEKG